MNRIAELREWRGLTQTQLGKRLAPRLSGAGVAELEREQVDIPLSVLGQIAEALHVRPYELILEPEDLRNLSAIPPQLGASVALLGR